MQRPQGSALIRADAATDARGAQAHRALNTGASTRGLVPMSRMASAASMPDTVVLARYVLRTSASSSGQPESTCVAPLPSRFARSCAARRAGRQRAA